MFNKIATLENTRRALVVIILLVLCAPVTTVVGDLNRSSEVAHKLKPDWDYPCLFSVREEIIARYTADPTDPVEYYRVLTLVHTWEAALSKHNSSLWRAKGQEIQDRQKLQSMAGGMMGLINDARQRYDKTFGQTGMYDAGRLCENSALAAPWAHVSIPFTPGLGGQFLAALFWMGILSVFFTFLKFWDEGNVNAFFRRLPLIVPMSFTIGPLAARYACADKQLIQSDVWLMTSFATAAVGVCMPGSAVLIKAQAPSPAKSKQSTAKTSSNQSDGAESLGESINNLPRVLKRIGFSQVDAEVLPGAGSKLREFAFEVSISRKLGEDGKLGLLTDFSFVELRQTVFQNNSFAFFLGEQRFLAPAGEVGYNQSAHAGFLSVGGKVVLSKTPGVGKGVKKAFDFAALSYLHRASGAAPTQQLVFVYDTRAVRIGHWVRIVGTGFWRYRMRTAINYGQQTVRIQVGSWTRFEPIVQFDTAGKTVGISAGVKLYLFPAR